MKKSDASLASVGTDEAKASVKSNGHASGRSEIGPAELRAILASLQTMRDGDFSVRLPGTWTGLAGKIADTFNDIVAANQQMAQELKRVGKWSVRKAGPASARGSTSRAALGERWKFR